MIQKRFQALDSCRGIAALMVAFYHFMVIDFSNPDLYPLRSDLIGNLWLFTDFFFVLSGFILSYKYYTKPVELTALLRARIFRLYPLHIFTTVLLLGITLGLKTDYTDGVFLSLLANLSSTHVFFDGLITWNVPSWSVSAEIFASIFAGLVFYFTQKWAISFFIPALAITVCAFLGLSAVTDTLNVTYGYGWVRGLLGFGLGCIAYDVYQRTWPLKISRSLHNFLEIFFILMALASIIYYQFLWFPLPLLCFSALILILAGERGRIAAFLKHRIFLQAGSISYSLYLNHFILVLMIQSFLNLAGISFIELTNVKGPVFYISLAVYFSVLVPCSVWTYKNIENPWRAAGKSPNAHGHAGRRRFAVWRAGRQ